jgi:hypothetical protein
MATTPFAQPSRRDRTGEVAVHLPSSVAGREVDGKGVLFQVIILLGKWEMAFAVGAKNAKKAVATQ